jgi:hypothetical protein
MKLSLRSLGIFFCCLIPLFGNAQSNHSFEFELAPILSDRIFRVEDDYDEWELNIYKSKSEILPGFYLQFGANFREDKRTRLYAGLRALNQQVMVSYYDIYSSFPRSERTDLLYFSLQLGVKQSLIATDNFRLVSEIGIAPGILIDAFPNFSKDLKFTTLSAECAFSFEWNLNSGNRIGFKLPTLSYSLLPNNEIYGDINQHNYSMGLGLKYLFSKTSDAN